jgi:hypothetical protein
MTGNGDGFGNQVVRHGFPSLGVGVPRFYKSQPVLFHRPVPVNLTGLR